MRWSALRDTERRSATREKAAKTAREGELTEARDRCAADRTEVTAACAKRRKRIRAQARRLVAREHEFRRDARDDYASTVGKAGPVKARMTKAESDSLAEHNIDPALLGVWREIRGQFPYELAPDHRAELFGEWAEEHPAEIGAWYAEQAERSPDYYAQAYAEHEAAS